MPADSSSERPGPTRFLVEHKAGEIIFRQGDPGADMFIIHAGVVEIVQGSGAETEHLAELEKGDFFGEMSLLEDLPRNASARAASDLELVRVDRATFDRMLRENPEIAVRIMRKLSRRLRDADHRLRRATQDPEPAADEPTPTPTHHLVHRDSELVYPIDGDSVEIGRSDPVTGIRPGIDLSPVDGERSSSRRHAKIYHEDGRLYLVEDLGTTNGTFVNGKRLQAGVPVPVAAGDVLRFGLVDLELSAGAGPASVS